jgi:branched-chain amino acid aminotransferase
VSEGSGENIFIVQNGVLCAPPLGASVLPGITRDCVIEFAAGLGIPVKEQMIPREALYLADEVFFTGSAAEITPIRTIDKITIGKGKRGPVTQKLQEQFFGVLSGEVEDKSKWLTPV